MKALAPDDPRVIGEYRLRAQLGAGGMGRVYLGLSPAGRAVAIKVVNPDLAEDAEFLHRFAQEVAAARAVSGIYTAPVVASGLDERPPWLATAFVPGPSLDQVVSENGPLPEPALWPLLAGLTEAMAAIHACGVVHRDLKPANVLLATDGPRVIDFGISRATDGTMLTAAGVVFGTPGYMSPEQAEGKPAGPASDMFALGCVIAYAATGAGPFGTGTAAAVLYRVVHGEAALDGVPPALREIVSGCLAKDPAARPAPAALAAAIAGRDHGTGPSAVAFWPRPVANVIGAYQDRLEQAFRAAPDRPAGEFSWASAGYPVTAPAAGARFGGRFGVARAAAAAERRSAGLGRCAELRRPAWSARLRSPAGLSGVAGVSASEFSWTPGLLQSTGIQPVSELPPASGLRRDAGTVGTAARLPAERPADGLPSALPGRPGATGSAAGQHAQRDRADVRWRRVRTGLRGRRHHRGGRDHLEAPGAAAVRAGSGRATVGGVVALTILLSLIEIALWLGIARACRNGKSWARVTGTVLFGLHTLGFLGVLANSHPGIGLAKVLTTLSWLIACGAVVFLWQRPSSVFFRAAATPGRPA